MSKARSCIILILFAVVGSATAVTIQVPANTPYPHWFDTGVSLSQGQSLLISATGSWYGSDTPPIMWYGPEGTGSPAPSIFLVPGVSSAALVGRIDSGSGFFVGPGGTFDASVYGTGTLYLAFNDEVNGYYNNGGFMSVTITGGGPPPGPTVTTQPATDVGQTTATLNGRIINDGGQACQYQFRYMKSGGSYTYTSWTGSVTTGQPFSQAVTGLDPGSTYHFNAKAKNSAGESDWGGEQMFATISPPATLSVSTHDAIQIAATSVVLNGCLVTDGGEACQYRFLYWASGGSEKYTAWTGSLHSYDTFAERVRDLTPGTPYCFEAQVRNSKGQASGDARSFVTLPEVPTVSTQSVTNLSYNSVTLRGFVDSDGGQACQYRFRYRKSGGSDSYTSWTGSVSSGQSFSGSISGLNPGSTYEFNAQAKNSAGEGAWSTSRSFITLASNTSAITGSPPQQNYFNGSQAGSGSTNDPVNTATGNLFHAETDLSIASRGLGLVFSRYYNSRDIGSGPLGRGWTHSYNVLLTEEPNLVSVQWEDGRTDYWNPDGSGGYEPNTIGLYDRLVRNGSGWVVTKKNLLSYAFDSKGRLASLSDKNGNTVTLHYDHPTWLNRVTSIADPAMRTLTLSYNSDGLLTRVADFASLPREVRFDYAGGYLTCATDVLGNKIRYGYNANGCLATVTDQRGITTVTNTYDAEGRVIEQLDGNGNKTVLAYDIPADSQTTITDANGNTTIHTHVTGYNLLYSITNPLGQSIYYCYDEKANRVSVIDRNGHAFAFAYDARGNVTQKTDPNDPGDGGTTVVEYKDVRFPDLPTRQVDALGRITQWQYDDKGNVVQQVDPNGTQRTWTYNTFGQKLIETAEDGSTTRFTYDSSGLLTEIVDPSGRHTWFGYDELRRLTHVTDGRGLSAGDPNHTIVTAYDVADRVTAITGPLTGMCFEYDQVGHRTKAINGKGFETLYGYDNNGNLTKIERVVPSGANQVVQYEYDVLDHRIKGIDANGNVATLEYDAAGRLVQQTNAEGDKTRYTYDPHGNLLSVTDASGVTVSFVYDALNRKTRQYDGLGNHWYWQYNRLGQLTGRTDANGHKTQYAYDCLARLISVTDPANGTTQYQYDAVGNLLQITDAAGKVIARRFYDPSSRLIRKEDGLGYAYQYTYDQAGNPMSEISPNGKTKIFQYDNENRLSEIIYPDSSKVAYSFDGNGNLTRMTDPTGVTIYTYDELDRLTSSTDSFGKTVGYSYDLVGNRRSITYPGDSRNPPRPVSYTYDKANRLQKIIDWAGRTWTVETDAAGRMTQMVYPNGIIKNIAHDQAGRLSSLSYEHQDRTPLMSYEYTRDPQGNPIGIVEHGTLKASSLPSLNGAYTYNENDWLLSSSPEPIAYTYDSSGNRTTQMAHGLATTFTYDNDNRLMSSTSPATYAYDNNGNLTSRVSPGASTSFTYDYDNRLTAQTTDISIVGHTYDGLGNRIARNEDGSATRYVLDRGRGMSHVLCETDGSGNIIAYYIHGPEIVGRIGSDGSKRYYHTDQIGNVVALTDQTQTVTDRYAYTPFGTSDGREGVSPNPFTYVGGLGVMAEADGMYFMRARFYDPDAGRFLSKDPVEGNGNAQRWDSYAYAGNSPLLAIDPAGTDWQNPLDWGISLLSVGGMVVTNAVTMPSGIILILLGLRVEVGMYPGDWSANELVGRRMVSAGLGVIMYPYEIGVGESIERLSGHYDERLQPSTYFFREAGIPQAKQFVDDAMVFWDAINFVHDVGELATRGSKIAGPGGLRKEFTDVALGTYISNAEGLFRLIKLSAEGVKLSYDTVDMVRNRLAPWLLGNQAYVQGVDVQAISTSAKRGGTGGGGGAH